MKPTFKILAIPALILVVLIGGGVTALYVVSGAMLTMPVWNTIQEYAPRHTVWSTDTYRIKGVSHFPVPTPTYPTGTVFYEREGMMQGGPMMYLYVPGTPAQAVDEQARMIAMGFTPGPELEGIVRIYIEGLDPIEASSSTTTISLRDEFSQRPGNARHFWCDTATGEMFYMGTFD